MDRLQDFADETSRDIAETGVGAGAQDAVVETPVVIGTDERRMHVRAYNYWVSLLNGRSYPSVDDLELGVINNDFSASSVLLDFTRSGEEPAIAWLGERLREECGLPVTVDSVAQVPARSLLSRLTDHHLQIIANRAPIGFEAEFVNARGNYAMYRGILLPFSSDNETIDFIYGVINWKEVANDAVVDAVAAELAQAIAPQPAPAPQLPAPKRQMVSTFADGPNATILSGVGDDDAPELDDSDALADWLAAARESADAALTADTRGRAALYRALGGAYDFAVIAEARPDEYVDLLSDAKIRKQDRAPMTPVVKLIFGSNYDKTRITEFAAALSFARRRELPTGGMRLFLESFPGGLKAVVAAERRERRPADKPAPVDTHREAARELPVQAYLTLPGNDEFVVLVARRVDPDRVAIIGVTPEDKSLLDRALKHITG